MTPPHFFEAVDGGDVRMVQCGEHLASRVEPRETIDVVRDRFGQDLDRDVAIQLRVARTIDLPHPALANGRQYFVGAETGAWGERQVADYMGVEPCGSRLLLRNAVMASCARASHWLPLGDYKGLIL